MIISVDDIVSMPDFIGQDTKILQKKLNALELLIRKYTNNNFQNRSIRFIGNSLGDRIFGGHPFIRIGDTIQISESEVNDGLYVVTEVGKNFIRLDKEVFNVDSNMVTKVVYPEDIQVGIINLLKLIPLDNMAMISELSASLDVKKITAIKVNSGLNKLAK